MKSFFILFYFSLSTAQAVGNSGPPYKLNNSLARVTPAPILKIVVDKLITDTFNMSYAALIVANGGLSPKVEMQVKKSLAGCRTKLDAINIEEHRKAFDNSLSGKAWAEIPTPAIYSSVLGCISEFKRDLASVDKNLIVPDNGLKDAASTLRNPKVFAELKKIDPYNIFLQSSSHNIFLRIIEKYISEQQKQVATTSQPSLIVEQKQESIKTQTATPPQAPNVGPALTETDKKRPQIQHPLKDIKNNIVEAEKKERPSWLLQSPILIIVLLMLLIAYMYYKRR